MNRIRYSLVPVVLIVSGLLINAQRPEITSVDTGNITLITCGPLKISGEKDEYYSVHVTLSYQYVKQQPTKPDHIDFLIQTVNKKRFLNPDLYIVFVIDGERIFLSSNRRAVKNPIPGRRFVGERIAMRMPIATLQRIANAESSAIRMGKTTFVIGPEQKAAMKELLAFSAT